MGWLRSFFHLTLAIRTAFHCYVGVYAARDLYDLHDATSGTLKRIALELLHINDLVKELEIPLVFYTACAVGLIILTCLYPWNNSQRSRVTTYAIFHVLYAAFVVYMVYVRTVLDISLLREVYKYMTLPWLFPASLVLDVLAIIAACVPTGSNGTTLSYASIVVPGNRIWRGGDSKGVVIPEPQSSSVPYGQFGGTVVHGQRSM